MLCSSKITFSLKISRDSRGHKKSSPLFCSGGSFSLSVDRSLNHCWNGSPEMKYYFLKKYRVIKIPSHLRGGYENFCGKIEYSILKYFNIFILFGEFRFIQWMFNVTKIRRKLETKNSTVRWGNFDRIWIHFCS